MVRGIRGNGPLDLAKAARLAEFFDEALPFFVGDQTRDPIHASLPVHGIAKRRGDGLIQEKRTPVP